MFKPLGTLDNMPGDSPFELPVAPQIEAIPREHQGLAKICAIFLVNGWTIAQTLDPSLGISEGWQCFLYGTGQLCSQDALQRA